MKIHIDDDFDLKKIADSGQCFRAGEVSEGIYRYITGDELLYIQELEAGDFDISCDMETWDTTWASYFDLGRDYSAIRSQSTGKHSFVDLAMDFGEGLRILCQDPWEMVVSFIISQRKSIPAISSCVEAICKRFGHPLDDEVYSFPTPPEMSGVSEEALRDCSIGYRAPYLLDAIERVLSHQIDLGSLSQLSDDELIECLKQIRGIGDKVANCVALFAYRRLSCVPVDVWIGRAIEEEFEGSFPYELFGDVSGIIQQYIFFYEKNRK